MIQNNARHLSHGLIVAAPGQPFGPLPDFNREVFCILGLPFDRVSLDEAVRLTQQAAVQGRRCFLSTPNLNFAIACLDDSQFRLSVIQSDLSIADGMPLIWIARATGLPIKERVAGSSLFQALRQAGMPTGNKAVGVYFFGGPPGVAQRASEKLNAMPSGMRAVGFDSPGFGSIEEMSDSSVIDRINASGADFLVVALGAKKGQAWIQFNLSRLTVPLVSHLGAVVNFVAGTVSRAPVWAQKSGMEWLWRIKEEPKLWKRYWQDGLGLLSVLVNRVVPLAVSRRQRAPAPSEFDKAIIDVRQQDCDCRLILTGALGLPNIARLRALLPSAADRSGPMLVDCSELAHIDSAALASLMLLYGACCARGRPWAMLGVSAALRRQFEWHCAHYLLQPLA